WHSRSNAKFPERVTNRKSETDPSRRMRNITSAVLFVFPGGWKRKAIWRTMFSRYPGNGNSTPSVLTLATSVPRPPSGPPPALGGGAVGLAGATSAVGVAGGVFLRGGGAFVFT